MTFEEFVRLCTQAPRIVHPRAWVEEPGLRLYVRKSIPHKGTDFDLASAEADKPGSGALTRFLDTYESRFTFYLECIVEPRLVPYYVRRGYQIIPGSCTWSPCMRKALLGFVTDGAS